jgi:hypothetical protein
MEILREALALAEEDAREAGAVGYAARLFAQLSLPYRDPGDVPVWERRNGSITLRVYPGLVPGNPGPRPGFPFGVGPRLLVTWMATEVVRTKNRRLLLGGSLSGFLRALDLHVAGGPRGTIGRLRSQMNRTFLSTMVVFDQQPGADRGGTFTFADDYELWWSDAHPADEPLWQSSVTLSERFYDSIVASPVPVDLRALRALRGSPLRLDIYTWLTYRMSYLRRQTTVPWEALAAQFGGDYKQLRQFKANFVKQLGGVRLVYPLADVEPTPAGLVLHPSPSHISPKAPLRHP